ncbi:hypothetical protein BCF11_0850 [Collimonas sp. PA-H2]|nr:hypothetical protein BCF11_0850 [Collimonas sp. PA-H2]
MRRFDFYHLFKHVQKNIKTVTAFAALPLTMFAWVCYSLPDACAQDRSQWTPAQIMQYIEEQKTKATAANNTSSASTKTSKAAPAPFMLEPSGRPWVLRFAPSTRIEDLKEPFKGNLQRFYAAMVQAGMRIVITTTYRPEERSYLMHYSTQIVRNKEAPATVPPWRGVNIDWVHRDHSGSKADLAKAKSAAREMVLGYGIGSTPVSKPGHSAHNFSQAIDMMISGFAGKTIVDAKGKSREVKSFIDLKSVGATYGVLWYGPEDSVHWSADGN